MGPSIAEAFLKGFGYSDSFIGRVCWLVGHHRTYDDIQKIDHQVLVEVDFLVNACENNLCYPFEKSFDKRLLQTIYLKQNENHQ